MSRSSLSLRRRGTIGAVGRPLRSLRFPTRRRRSQRGTLGRRGRSDRGPLRSIWWFPSGPARCSFPSSGDDDVVVGPFDAVASPDGCATVGSTSRSGRYPGFSGMQPSCRNSAPGSAASQTFRSRCSASCHASWYRRRAGLQSPTAHDSARQLRAGSSEDSAPAIAFIAGFRLDVGASGGEVLWTKHWRKGARWHRLVCSRPSCSSSSSSPRSWCCFRPRCSRTRRTCGCQVSANKLSSSTIIRRSMPGCRG